MRPLYSNTTRVGILAAALAGNSTAHSRDIATSPRGILQQIENFFTCNGVRNALLNQYQSLMVAMVEDLDKQSSQYTIPHVLTVYHCGCRITFCLPYEHDPQGAVTIEVSKNNCATFRAEVEHNRYRSICTALLVRYRCGLSLAAPILTHEGKIDLKNVNLHSVNLHGVNLQYADLEGVNMRGTDMSSACLKGANLRGAKLVDVKLQEADLQEANLRDTNLGHTNLGYTNLTRANLCNADLRNAYLINTNLTEANLTESNLQDISLNWVTLSRASLARANLRGGCLQNVKLNETDLREADLQGARLGKLSLNSANLEGAVLDNVVLKNPLLWLPLWWDEENLDYLLNHLSIPERGSLLTMMDSIDARYSDIKVKMAGELATSLQGASSLPLVTHALLDVLSKAPWKDDPAIDAWLEQRCLDYLRYHNTHVMPQNPARAIRYAARQLNCQQELMENLGGAFIQLVDQGIAAAENEADSKAITDLYECYLNREKIRPWTALEVFGDYSGKPDWGECHAENYIMLSPGADGHIMLLSQHTLHGMLRPDPRQPVWGHFYLYNRQQDALPMGKESLEELFSQHFPVFIIPFMRMQRECLFPKLLNLLNLAELQDLFFMATRQKVWPIKLLKEEQQQRLRDIFTPLLDDSYSLEEEHYHQIIRAYGLTCASNNKKAMTLLCLAAVFTKYSSREIFGAEDESPVVLRIYACALMVKAYALDKTVFFNSSGGNYFSAWRACQLGLNDAFSCSGTLSSDMIAHARQYFPEVLAGTLPPSWY